MENVKGVFNMLKSRELKSPEWKRYKYWCKIAQDSWGKDQEKYEEAQTEVNKLKQQLKLEE